MTGEGELARQRLAASARARAFIRSAQALDEEGTTELSLEDLEQILNELDGLRLVVSDFTEAWSQAGTITDLAARLNFSEAEPIAGLYAAVGRHQDAADVMEAWVEGEEDYDPDDDEEWGNQTAIINEYRELAAMQRAAEGGEQR